MMSWLLCDEPQVLHSLKAWRMRPKPYHNICMIQAKGLGTVLLWFIETLCKGICEEAVFSPAASDSPSCRAADNGHCLGVEGMK